MSGGGYVVHWRDLVYPTWQVDSADHPSAAAAIERALQLRLDAPAVEVQVVDDAGVIVWPPPLPPAR